MDTDTETTTRATMTPLDKKAMRREAMKLVNAEKKARLALAKAKKPAKKAEKANTKAKARNTKPEAARKIAKAQDAEKAEKVTKTVKPTKAERDIERASNIPAPSVTVTSNMAPGVEIATELDAAFAYLNEKLFDGKVEPCVLMVAKLKRSYGHFWHSQFARRGSKGGNVHEIGIDFRRLALEGGGDLEVLSTIAHEMAHALVYQIDKAEAAKHGGEFKPKVYHCGVWAAVMNKAGLKPVAMDAHGVPNGKETGQHSTHEIVKGGPFEVAAKALLAQGFKLNWSMIGGYYDEMGRPMPVVVGKGGKMSPGSSPEPKARRAKAGAKAVHVCPSCASKVWGKPSLVAHCHGTKTQPHPLAEMECDREAYGAGIGGVDMTGTDTEGSDD